MIKHNHSRRSSSSIRYTMDAEMSWINYCFVSLFMVMLLKVMVSLKCYQVRTIRSELV